MAKKKDKKASYKPTYVTAAQPKSMGAYKSTQKAPAAYQPGTYSGKYDDQIQSALNTVTNWRYDPMQDANYQALAKIYGARGNIAAKNTLADAAALNGGYGTSYAVSAAQQARNQYNQELAGMIPELEAQAFSRAQTTYNALRDADDTDYGRYRDTEADRQWKYSQDYNAYRDREADSQWAYTQQQIGKKINSTFLRMLPWMLPKAPKDENAFERIVKDCKATYQSWDEEMFSFVDDVIRNITINPSEKLKLICPNCGEEVISGVRFPNGIKYLFSVQGGHKKFGSK